jgi:hypothetical protein
MQISRRLSKLGSRLQKLEKVDDTRTRSFEDCCQQVRRIARKNLSGQDRKLLPEAIALHKQNVLLSDAHQAVLDRWVAAVQEGENEVLRPQGMHRDDLESEWMDPMTLWGHQLRREKPPGVPGG